MVLRSNTKSGLDESFILKLRQKAEGRKVGEEFEKSPFNNRICYNASLSLSDEKIVYSSSNSCEGTKLVIILQRFYGQINIIQVHFKDIRNSFKLFLDFT